MLTPNTSRPFAPGSSGIVHARPLTPSDALNLERQATIRVGGNLLFTGKPAPIVNVVMRAVAK